MSICRLCGTQAQLLESHVLPAFVFRWLRKDGHIRRTDAVNKRVQGGPTERWLCESCEARLCSWEARFANDIFFPYAADSTLRASYGNWLLLFCVSVSWRVLMHLKQVGALSEFSAFHKARTDDALATWEKVLLGGASHPGDFEQHLVAFDLIESANGLNLPRNINRYLTRAVEVDVARGGETCFVYSKIGRFAILGMINRRATDVWEGSRVKVRGGLFAASTFTMPHNFANFLFDRARRLDEKMRGLSETQSKKIAEAVEGNLDRFANSDLFRAIRRDAEMFGIDAVIAGAPDGPAGSLNDD